MNQSKLYFHNLDVIRFFAAFFVVMGHGFGAWKDYFVRFRNTSEYTENLFSGSFEYLDRFMANMGIGVEIFFFISGFLITYILLCEKAKTGKIQISKFYARRALRILPLYYFLILLAPFIIWWMEMKDPPYLANIFFYSNFHTIQQEIWQYPFSHFWSISIEEQFYFIWPVLIALTPANYLKHLCFFLILGSIAFRFWIFQTDPTSWNINLHLFSRMDTLVIGSLIALGYHKKSFKFNIHWGFAYACLLMFFILLIFTNSSDYTSLFKAVLFKYIFLFTFGTYVLYLIFKEKKHKESSKLFRLISYLGKISYGIYLFHNIFLLILIKKILLNNRLDSWLLFWVAYIAGTILLAVISYEILEKPFLKLKRKFTVIKTRDSG